MTEETPEPEAPRRDGLARVLLAVVILLLLGVGYLGYRILGRLEAVDTHVAELVTEAGDASRISQHALARAVRAEESAREAAQGRDRAEAETEGARQLADAAMQDAAAARGEAADAQAVAEQERQRAATAQAQAEEIRAKAEAEMDRLQTALGAIAETRRNALGLVMNLGEEHLRFEFDKAELRPADRELLSRIAGVLLGTHDYSISVNGHTDDVGSDAYNQKLSERRARAVRDYLVEAGLPAAIFTVTGYGKRQPLVRGTSDEARAKNRRVELGIVNTRILYGPDAR